MIKVAYVRGAYLNNFEAQNYLFEKNVIQLTGFCTLNPIHAHLPFPIVKLPSIHDLTSVIPAKAVRYLANRAIGDSQLLYGLENYANQFDIFHTADAHYYYSYQLARLKAQKKIKRLVVTAWETIPFNNETVERKKQNKYFVYGQADAFLCYSQKSKDCLIQEGVDKDKITVITLGVDINYFKPANYKQKISTLLLVGRLVKEKGILDLYEAFKQLENRPHLRIIGDGPLYDTLLKKIRQDKLDKLITIEVKSYEQMARVYQDANIFVLPSKTTGTWEEQYGMVLVEAMASGLPIIAYKSGAIPEVIGDTGLLIKPTINSLVTALSELLEDSKKRQSLASASRHRALTYFDSEKTAKRLSHFYTDLLKR